PPPRAGDGIRAQPPGPRANPRRRTRDGGMKRAVALSFILPILAAIPAHGQAPDRPDAGRPVVIASKPFGKSYLLAEMFAQLLEARRIPVDRRLGLGATEIAFAALRSGAVDVYPEYTGTGLLAILHRDPVSDADSVFSMVSREFARRWGVRWLPPLGFENTYAIAVRRETARE